VTKEVCIVDGCDRIRDKKQNRKICQMHRVRYGRYKSYDLPTAPKLPEGILKICKNHGELKASQVYKRIKGKNWLSCRQCVKECNDRFDKKVGSSFRNNYKKNFYLTKGGKRISKERYYQLMEKQNNLCAICKQSETIINSVRNNVPKRLALDHNHKTGIIRGLLCHRCNVSIGAFRDSIDILQAAIAYLQVHQ
jgi:hypothetical protein